MERLKRRLARLVAQRDEMLKKHNGNELNFTYWAGYELGYAKGKINEIEDRLDDSVYTESVKMKPRKTIFSHTAHKSEEFAKEYIAGLPYTEVETKGKTNIRVINSKLFLNSLSLWQTNAEIEFED